MNYFLHDKNLQCQCGKCKGFTGIDKKLEDKLNVARFHAGIPFYINSGFRCLQHPESIKKPTSSHILGLAVDIAVTTSRGRSKILSGLIEAKFTRIGIGKDFIHVDIDTNKDKEVTWIY